MLKRRRHSQYQWSALLGGSNAFGLLDMEQTIEKTLTLLVTAFECPFLPPKLKAQLLVYCAPFARALPALHRTFVETVDTDSSCDFPGRPGSLGEAHPLDPLCGHPEVVCPPAVAACPAAVVAPLGGVQALLVGLQLGQAPPLFSLIVSARCMWFKDLRSVCVQVYLLRQGLRLLLQAGQNAFYLICLKLVYRHKGRYKHCYMEWYLLLLWGKFVLLKFS